MKWITLLAGFMVTTSWITAAPPLEDFRLPGWKDYEVVIPEMRWYYKINSMNAEGTAFVGSERVYYLSLSSIRHYPFYYSMDVGYREIPLPEGVTLQSPSSSKGWAEDLSADGQIVVGNIVNAEGGTEAFRYFVTEDRTELMVTFLDVVVHDRTSAISYASGISADGSVIVGKAIDSDGRMMAFRWTEDSGMQRIYDTEEVGFSLSWAMDVSADGSRICGFIRNADGSQEGFYQDNGGEIHPLSIEGGDGFLVMGKISGSENYVTGYGRRIQDGVIEQVGIAWNNQDQFTIFPAISSENRVALFSVSGDLQVATGEAYSESLSLFGWRPYIWTKDNGPSWADEYIQNRYEITDMHEGSGLFGLRSAYISEDGSVLYLVGAFGPYRFDLGMEPEGSYMVFQSSTFNGEEGNTVRQSPWFGDLDVESFPWTWHHDLGWIYIHPDSREETSVCFFDQASGYWLSSSMDIYPAVYNHSTGFWLWHFIGSRWFYDFSVADWVEFKSG